MGWRFTDDVGVAMDDFDVSPETRDRLSGQLPHEDGTRAGQHPEQSRAVFTPHEQVRDVFFLIVPRSNVVDFFRQHVGYGNESHRFHVVGQHPLVQIDVSLPLDAEHGQPQPESCQHAGRAASQG